VIILEEFDHEDTLEETEDSSQLEESPSTNETLEPNQVALPESAPISMVSPGKAKGLADLAALKKLFKFKIIVSGVIIFIFLMLIFMFISQEAEVKYDYLKPNCEEVIVHFLHRGEQDLVLSLEEYVEDMVYSLTRQLHSPKRVLYQAVAIAVRTNAQNLSQCTINISDEVDAYYTFETLTEDNSRYQEIHQSVEYVSGVVMVENQQFVAVDFDSFCYRDIITDMEYDPPKEFYTIYNPYEGPMVPLDWVVDNVSNELFRDCKCTPNTSPSTVKYDKCWVQERYPQSDDEDAPIYYLYVDGGGSGKGLSVYTAHFLSSKPGYDDENILRFFYPSDWKHYTVGISNAKEDDINGVMSCSYFDFNQTPLSRSEFISLVDTYLSGKGSQTARLFRENAGEIYDLGEEIGANPEMVYIVAEKEQGWRDGDFSIRCNNFYGMGVTNGSSTGRCYNSFLDGTRDMLNYVKGKGDLTSFTKVYSYLGTYLANPGSSGDGGCYYLTLNDIYGKNYSRCNSNYSCASSRGGAGCVLTTEAEKQAYIDWQASKILKIRSNIFHIEAEDCSVSDAFSANVSVGDAGSVDSNARMKWLFPNGVPRTKGEAEAYLTTISVPIVTVGGGKSTMSITVHKKLAKEVNAIFEEMVEIGFPVNSAGGYSYRNMASGTGSLSHHSYGVAIDINASANPAIYQSSNIDRNSPYYINSKVVALWKKHGFYWGGDWSSNYYDPMHFTYTNH